MRRFESMDAAASALPRSVAAELPSPALVIRVDCVRENVRRVIDCVGGPDRWRPHVKTTKTPAVWAILVEAGIRAFKCATTREAACLLRLLDARGVAGDVLVAHPLVGPNLARLGRLAADHPGNRLSVLVEDAEGAAATPPGVGVFLDLNPGFDRTGAPLDRHAALVTAARAARGRFRGAHFYEGHLHDLEPARRRREAFAGYGRLVAALDALEAAGCAIEEIVTSGTPTFADALAYAPLRARAGTQHRVSPGTVVFSDLRTRRERPGVELEPAALVFSRVVSRPAPDIVTCDAGSKSIAAEVGDPCAEVVGRPELVALRPSEEHLPLRVTSGAPPPRGAGLLLVPAHVCPTVNLAERALLVNGGDVVAFADVAARAHEVEPRETGASCPVDTFPG